MAKRDYREFFTKYIDFYSSRFFRMPLFPAIPRPFPVARIGSKKSQLSQLHFLSSAEAYNARLTS